MRSTRPASSVFALAAGLLCSVVVYGQDETSLVRLKEEFQSTSTIESNWVRVISGDFDEAVVEISGSLFEGKLRLGANTLGTDPKTVKFLGVRSREPLQLQIPFRVSWVLDWNDQSNGSYLSAGLLLSPHATQTRPTSESDWLQVSYVGVPPGKNARLEMNGRFSGSRNTFYSEGWPTVNRIGREIGLQSMDLLIAESGLELIENGKPVFQSRQILPFQEMYVYLFLTSHSNYEFREIYFDNIVVKETNQTLQYFSD